MGFKLTDQIAGGVRGSVSVAIGNATRFGAKRLGFLTEFFIELYRICSLLGWDFAILVGQSANETGFWAGRGPNPNWTTLGNPAGLAITNGENLSVTYANGTDAARALAVHWWVYLYGPLGPTDHLYQWRNLDGHYEAAAYGINTKASGGDGRPFAGSVVTIGDLNVNGRWCLLDRRNTPTGPLDDYGNRVLADTQRFWGSMPDQDPIVRTPSTPEEPVPTDPSMDPRNLTTGTIKHPPVDIRDVSKPNVQSGYGFDTVPRRVIRGTCTHEWDGAMTRDQVIRFFGPNGERYTNALVDYVNMKDGYLIRLNDPLGTRSPWASGGGVLENGGLEGDGPAFYAKFGLGAINANLISTEIMKQDWEDYTDEQIETQAMLAAYWHDRDGQFWFEHPYTSKYGIVMSFLHFEFGTTSCGKGELDDITRVQSRTRAIMKAAQYRGVVSTNPGDVNPPDVPVLPAITLPGNVSVSDATERFGKLRKIDAKVGTGKIVATYGFDPAGMISLGWAQKCNALFGSDVDRWPAAGDWITFGEPVDKTTLDLITFDGSDLMMLRKSEKQAFIWA